MLEANSFLVSDQSPVTGALGAKSEVDINAELLQKAASPLRQFLKDAQLVRVKRTVRLITNFVHSFFILIL